MASSPKRPRFDSEYRSSECILDVLNQAKQFRYTSMQEIVHIIIIVIIMTEVLLAYYI